MRCWNNNNLYNKSTNYVYWSYKNVRAGSIVLSTVCIYFFVAAMSRWRIIDPAEIGRFDILRDVTDFGHLGTGNLEITIKSLVDFEMPPLPCTHPAGSLWPTSTRRCWSWSGQRTTGLPQRAVLRWCLQEKATMKLLCWYTPMPTMPTTQLANLVR